MATPQKLLTADYRRTPEGELSFSSTAECNEAFRELFISSVRRRIASTQPVVVQLSGGIDSTSIVCVADRLLSEEPGLVPAVFGAAAIHPGLSCDENTYIDAVAEHVRIPIVRWDGTRVSDLEFADPFLAAPGNRMPMANGTESFVQISRAHSARVSFMEREGISSVGDSALLPMKSRGAIGFPQLGSYSLRAFQSPVERGGYWLLQRSYRHPGCDSSPSVRGPSAARRLGSSNQSVVRPAPTLPRVARKDGSHPMGSVYVGSLSPALRLRYLWRRVNGTQRNQG